MEQRRLSNSRLLYQRSKIDASWIKSLARIDRAIEEHPRLQRTSEQVHLYFFKPGKEISSEDELWVGREIAGFVNPGELEGLDTYDLARGPFFTKDFQMGQKLLFEELLGLEEELRSSSGKSLAPTWRVSFLAEDSLIRPRIGLFLA